MCLMIKQMDLVLKSIEFADNATEDKDTALSIMADIVARGCRDCEVEKCGSKEITTTPIPVVIAYAEQAPSLSPAL